MNERTNSSNNNASRSICMEPSIGLCGVYVGDGMRMKSKATIEFESRARSIRCSFCGARLGKPCMTAGGKDSQSFHTVRRKFALSQMSHRDWA